MKEYLNNNLVSSLIIAMISTALLYYYNRKNNENINYMTYIKHFISLIILIWLTLYFKSSNNIQLNPLKGGGLSSYQDNINIGEPNF